MERYKYIAVSNVMDINWAVNERQCNLKQYESQVNCTPLTQVSFISGKANSFLK